MTIAKTIPITVILSDELQRRLRHSAPKAVPKTSLLMFPAGPVTDRGDVL